MGGTTTETPSVSPSQVQSSMATPSLHSSESQPPRVAQVASMAAVRQVEVDADEQRDRRAERGLSDLFVGFRYLSSLFNASLR